MRPSVTAVEPHFGGPDRDRGLFVSFDLDVSDRTSDVPSLPRCSSLLRLYLRLRRARFHPRPRVGNARFSRARTSSTQQNPSGRLRTVAFLMVSHDPAAGALHPRLSLRAIRFRPAWLFAATGFPVRRRLQVSAAQHDPRTRPAVFRSPHASLSRLVHGRRTSEEIRQSRALARGAALLRAAEPLPKVIPGTSRRPSVLRSWWGAPRLRIERAQTPLLSSPREGLT
jgi:hypothetical protein